MATHVVLEYTVPSHYLSYLCNGDDSGLDGDELETIKAFLKAEDLGNHDWDVKRDADGVAETYTSSWHDLNGSQASVLDFVVTVYGDKG
jgi:hypothetical protein